MTVETLAERGARYRPAVVHEMRAVIGEHGDELSGWLRYHMGWEDRAGRPVAGAGGKMLRPTALLLTHELLGGALAQALPAAAAVELAHNFSLLHDDIEDASETRHGRATLWTFVGVAQAVNAGDGMYTLARTALYRLLDAGVPHDRVLAAMRELDHACLRLVHGQALDIGFEGQSQVTRAEYLEMAAGKTAAMFAASFALGARLAGAEPAVVDGFRRFGHAIGIAFQAVDDVLGIWGVPEQTGKPVGDDLRARKMTLPVTTALEAGGELAERLRAAYDVPPTAGEDVLPIARLIESAGGRAATETLARERVADGLAALRAAGVDEGAARACAEFAEAAVGRVT
ncbi:MAG: polyprenyl synthetase family protein [Chloroflexi bacterium]|nr:polyprenyl synthetase family protein [Chloroflexota bacterium]